MKKVFNYLSVIVGCELIAISFVLLILPNKVLSFGIDGVGALLYYTNNVNPGINILVLNAIFILLSLSVDEQSKIIDRMRDCHCVLLTLFLNQDFSVN